MVQILMTITLNLTHEQEDWLRARVAAGDVASIEEAARRAIDERIAEDRRGQDGYWRRALLVSELSDADIAEIAASKMDPRYNYLNDELK